MTDPHEVQLSKLAKRVLSMPPKKREESKIGKRKSASKDASVGPLKPSKARTKRAEK
jgi:hypothetical protein